MNDVEVAPEIAAQVPVNVEASIAEPQAYQTRVSVGVACPAMINPVSSAVTVAPIANEPLNVGVPLIEAVCRTVVGPKAAEIGALPFALDAVTLK